VSHAAKNLCHLLVLCVRCGRESGHFWGLAPDERIRVVEYGLAATLITFWIGAHAPLNQAITGTRRGGVGRAATTETLQPYIVTLYVIIAELSRIAHPIRGSVLGIVTSEHLFAIVRRLCRTDQKADALDRVFEWSIPRSLYRSDLGVLARLDLGRMWELCEYVPFHPLPVDFENTPIGSARSQVMGALSAARCRLSIIDGLPFPYESPVFQDDVVTSPAPTARKAIAIQKERFAPTAARNHWEYHISGTQVADNEHGAG
jgi:hypothetical protein